MSKLAYAISFFLLLSIIFFSYEAGQYKPIQPPATVPAADYAQLQATSKSQLENANAKLTALTTDVTNVTNQRADLCKITKAVKLIVPTADCQ